MFMGAPWDHSHASSCPLMPRAFFNPLIYKAEGGMARRQNAWLRVRQNATKGAFWTRSAATKPRRGRNSPKAVPINPSPGVSGVFGKPVPGEFQFHAAIGN
jgi:hypothetical protein